MSFSKSAWGSCNNCFHGELWHSSPLSQLKLKPAVPPSTSRALSSPSREQYNVKNARERAALNFPPLKTRISVAARTRRGRESGVGAISASLCPQKLPCECGGRPGLRFWTILSRLRSFGNRSGEGCVFPRVASTSAENNLNSHQTCHQRLRA